MSEDEDKKIKGMVLKAALDLGEHFDNVLVMVSFQTLDGRTRCIKRRAGSWHACLGMAHEFIGESNAADIAEAVGDKLEPPDDFWKV